MVRNIEEHSLNHANSSSLDELHGRVIAIEAAHYLSRILTHDQYKEYLLPALGGLPFAMRRLVETDLNHFKQHAITPVFVFNGMDIGRKDRPFDAADKVARLNAQAWDLYNRHDAERAVETFGSGCSQEKIYRALTGVTEGEMAAIQPDNLYRSLQLILRDAGIIFQVAPYSAWAQLSYLLKEGAEFIDAVSGSSEMLVYDIESVITDINFDRGDFVWVSREKCIKGLGNIHPDMFVDACLLSGSSYLPALPQLDGPGQRNKNKLQGALELMMSFGRNGISVCLNYQDDPQVRSLDYIDKYKKSRLAIKHHVIMTKDGRVIPFDKEEAPRDIHEFIGQRLGEEVYFYLSRALINPKILYWRTSGEILELPSLDSGDSEEYHILVRDQLTSLRTSALSLLSSSLHRFYQHNDVTLRCWFDRDNSQIISMRDLEDPKPMISSWNVHAGIFQAPLSKFVKSGLLGSAVQSLKDPDFAAKTITSKNSSNILKTKEEIMTNSVWRFLHLRGYLDAKHTLTAWGRVLETTLSALGGRRELEEAAFLAVELARLDLLNYKSNLPPSFGGYPTRGSDEDKTYNVLVSRIACLGKLRHHSIGFTGPLSRYHLAYHSIISAVRRSLRDLTEVCVTTLLLNGDASKDRTDLTDISLDLPFLLDTDCALGIAVKAYLDEVAGADEPSSVEMRNLIKAKATKEWFPESENYSEDLETAWLLWDAVYAGVKVADRLVKDQSTWDEVNTWLATRR